MLQKISNKRFTFELSINLSILKEEKYIKNMKYYIKQHNQ